MESNSFEVEASVVRRRSRSQVEIELTVDLESEHNLWCGLSNDVADGGVFVATHESLEPGTQVRLAVHLPGFEEPFALQGIVRWTRAHSEESDGPAGVGVKFVAIDTGTLSPLSRF